MSVEAWLGYVTQVNPLRVRRDYPTSEAPPETPMSLVPGLRVGDKVYLQMHANKLTVMGKVKPVGRGAWNYQVASSQSVGWKTVASFPGSGRASGLFSIHSDDSGDHDQLVFQADVAYRYASLSLLSSNTFGRTSPVVSAIRYLNDSADATYGPGLLQIYIGEGTTGSWSVTCEQLDDPLLKPWMPGLFSDNISGYSTTPATQVGVYATDTQVLALENGYAHYSGAPSWDEARVTMAPGSMVTLSGLVRYADATSQTITTLPPGLRPRGDIMFPTYAFPGSGSAVMGRVQITDAGLVQMTVPAYGTAGGYVSLSGITFAAYQ